MLQLVHEMHFHGVKVNLETTAAHCRVFEDNSGALEMAKVAKHRPRTKHINVKYHHFRSYVEAGVITVHKVDTDDQVADTLTKPLMREKFERHRRTLTGW
jgi:hypothetical protein